MKSGFSFSDIQEMTIDQAQLFLKAVNKVKTNEMLNDLNLMRVAAHADQKAFTTYVRDLKKMSQ